MSAVVGQPCVLVRLDRPTNTVVRTPTLISSINADGTANPATGGYLNAPVFEPGHTSNPVDGYFIELSAQ